MLMLAPISETVEIGSIITVNSESFQPRVFLETQAELIGRIKLDASPQKIDRRREVIEVLREIEVFREIELPREAAPLS
jgi:hypothetical protein